MLALLKLADLCVVVLLQLGIPLPYCHCTFTINFKATKKS